MSNLTLFYIHIVCIGCCCVFLFNHLAIFSSLYILKVVHHVRVSWCRWVGYAHVVILMFNILIGQSRWWLATWYVWWWTKEDQPAFGVSTNWWRILKACCVQLRFWRIWCWHQGTWFIIFNVKNLLLTGYIFRNFLWSLDLWNMLQCIMTDQEDL